MSIKKDIIRNNSLTDNGKILAGICEKYYYLEKQYSTSRLYQNSKLQEYAMDFSHCDDLYYLNRHFRQLRYSINTEEEFMICFAYIKRVDELLYDEKCLTGLSYGYYECMSKVKEKLFGVLIIGRKVWCEPKFTEGSYPFTNIRFLILSSEEYVRFLGIQKTTEKIAVFMGGDMDVLVSHSNNNYSLLSKIEGKLSYGNYGIDLGINVKVTSDGNEVLPDMVETGVYKCSKTTYEVIKKAIDNCEENTALLVFPEVMIAQNELDSVIELLNNNSSNIKNARFVVIGVYDDTHHNNSQKTSNKSYNNLAVILFKSGDIWKKLTEYKKIIPSSMFAPLETSEEHNIKNKMDYSSKDKVVMVENLNIANKNEFLTFIPCEDCIIGVAICRDVLDMLNLDNPLHRYVDIVDLLIVISYNAKDTNMFMGAAECLSRWHNCGVVYTNHIGICDSDDELIEVSFVLTPFKSKISGTTSLTGVVCYRNCLIKPNGTYDSKMPILYQEINDYDTVATYHLHKTGRVEFSPQVKLFGERSKNELLTIDYEVGEKWRDVIHRYDKLIINCRGKVMFVKKYSNKTSEEFCILDVTNAPSDISQCTIDASDVLYQNHKYKVETL